MSEQIEIKVILKGKVRFMQDFGFKEADFGDGFEFECRGIVNGQLVLRAPGFGAPENYGNGSISIVAPTLGPFDE
jgi:hypothetical protein